MGEPGPFPDDALENIAYLSRSDNRVRILEALTTEPYPRRELGEVTDTSRTTLGRILSEFEDRGWAERTTEGTYAATPRGKHVAREFRPLVEAMEAVENLGEAVAWIPIDELSIGLHHFSDATVTRASPNEPVQSRELADMVRNSSTFETLTFLSPPPSVGEAMQEGVEAGRLSAEHVFAGGLFEYLRNHPEGPPAWHDYIEAGAQVYRYDGHIPCNLFVFDESVHILNDRPERADTIHCESETVRTWARELIARYREEAERVSARSFFDE